MMRFSMAMGLFAVLAALSWITLTDQRIRGVTLLVLGLFAFRTWVHRRRERQTEQERQRIGTEVREPM